LGFAHHHFWAAGTASQNLSGDIDNDLYSVLFHTTIMESTSGDGPTIELPGCVFQTFRLASHGQPPPIHLIASGAPHPPCLLNHQPRREPTGADRSTAISPPVESVWCAVMSGTVAGRPTFIQHDTSRAPQTMMINDLYHAGQSPFR
jgi:hypothetical protein